MKTSRVWAVALMMGTLTLTSHLAEAAYLQLEPDKSFKRENPQGPTPHPPTTCNSAGSASGNIDVTPNGQSGSAVASTFAALSGDCDSLQDISSSTDLAFFTIQPNAGETVGEPLIFCFQANFNQDVSASGFTSQSLAAGSNPTDPAAIILNPNTTPQVVFSYGPQTLTNNQTPISLQRRGQFVANIGDEIELTLGVLSEVQANGAGSGFASASGLLSVTVGPCPAPQEAPALSSTGIGFLVVILSMLGLALLRRELRSHS